MDNTEQNTGSFKKKKLDTKEISHNKQETTEKRNYKIWTAMTANAETSRYNAKLVHLKKERELKNTGKEQQTIN